MRTDPIVLDHAEATLQLLQSCQSGGAAERQFVLLNRSREVWPYQTALLWRDGCIAGHSGVGQVEAQGPYAQWVRRLAHALRDAAPGAVDREGLNHTHADLTAEWDEYWPPHLVWLPSAPHAAPEQALVVVADMPWKDREVRALARWWLLWQQADRQGALADKARATGSWTQRLFALVQGRRARTLWVAAAALLGLLLCPVALTLRAPGELVPREPLVLRAAVDGTVRSLKVEPNQTVRAGQVVVELDDAGWHSRLEVARQGLLTAEAEWRQVSQQALNDPRAKGQLAAAQGKVEERQAEVAFLTEQAQRATLVAPIDGVVLIQDPGSWPGRTVSAGEAVLKIAQPQDQELEAWLPVSDAIDLPAGTAMTLHLASTPGVSVPADLRLYAFEAESRSDVGLGYRLRGTLRGPATERLGVRGTVRIEGPRVALAYWVLRRPLAALREATGW